MSFKRFTRKNLLLGTEDYLPAKVPPLEKPYRKLKIVSSQYAANQATTLTVPSLKSRNNNKLPHKKNLQNFNIPSKYKHTSEFSNVIYISNSIQSSLQYIGKTKRPIRQYMCTMGTIEMFRNSNPEGYTCL